MTEPVTTSTDVSRAVQEPLYGTARENTAVFFLLEYNGSYTAEVWRDAEIPPAVKQRLTSYPASHALLIRQPLRAAESDGKLTLLVACCAQQPAQVYRVELNAYEDLLALDLDAIVRGELLAPETGHFYMVCTNGRRDVCCSRYGFALYTALVEIAGENVWQISHIGGHRFAGTMYCFPHGLCYGYLDASDAPEIVRATEAGEVLLSKYRGRSTDLEPVQAADYFLRQELRLHTLSALTVERVTQQGEYWDVTLTAQDVRYLVSVERGAALMVLKTTGDAEYAPVRPFRLRTIDRI